MRKIGLMTASLCLLATPVFAQVADSDAAQCDISDGFGQVLKVPCSEAEPAAQSQTNTEDQAVIIEPPVAAPAKPAPASNLDLDAVIALIAEQVTKKVSADIEAKLEALVTAPPSPDKEPTALLQEDIVEDANARSRSFTSPATGKPGGRVEMVFGEGVPTLICAPMQQCIIELEDGEVLSDVTALSETSRWSKFLRHRTEPNEKTIIGLQPHIDAEEATLSFLTDRRLYVIRLIPRQYDNTYILSFTYPDTAQKREAEYLAEQKAARAAKAAAKKATHAKTVNKSGVQTRNGYVPAKNLTFGKISGKAPFKPSQVYWDGRNTYIVLPQNYRGDIPSVDIPAGQPAPVITVDPSNSKLLILDREIKSFSLSLGRASVRVKS